MRPCSFLFYSVRFQIDILWNIVLDHFLVYLNCYCETKVSVHLAVTWNGTHIEVTDEFLWASTYLPLLRWSQLLIHTSGSRYLCNFDTSPTQICVAFNDVFHFGRQLGVSECSLLDSKCLWWCASGMFYVHWTFLSLFVSLLKEGSLLQFHKGSSVFKLVVYIKVLKLTNSCVMQILHLNPLIRRLACHWTKEVQFA